MNDTGNRPGVTSSGHWLGFSAWIRRALPTAITLAALGGLTYWGHHTEWNFVQSATPASETVRSELKRVDRETLQFASEEAATKLGIDVAAVSRIAMSETITASGEVNFDQTRVVRLSSRAAGTARLVTKKVGDRVSIDDLLALVDAAEVGKAKAEFQHALVGARLKKKAVDNLRAARGAIPERSAREADAALRETEVQLVGAEQALANLGLPVRSADLSALSMEQVARHVQFLGIPPELVRTFDPLATTANLLPIRSRMGGVLLGSDLVVGEVVDPSKVLFVVADPAMMWVTLNIAVEDAGRVKLGQPAQFRPDGGGTATGRVSWISTAVDEKTRTIKVRADLDNESGKLRASTFGVGRITLREEQKALVVPSEAIQFDGGSAIVFVRNRDYLEPEAPKLFRRREVRVGTSNGTQTEILSGVSLGEVVAEKGAASLLNELLKNRQE